jgi:hypothetical protein
LIYYEQISAEELLKHFSDEALKIKEHFTKGKFKVNI